MYAMKLKKPGRYCNRKLFGLSSAALFSMNASWPSAALAHAAEQGFVLLLPTDLYISAGIATVALTAAALALFPAALTENLLVPRKFAWFRLPGWLCDCTSLCSLAILALLVVVGLTGSGDPLSNPLPLTVWTFWWTAMLFLQGVLGDIWKWTNPWTGAYSILIGKRSPGQLTLPDRLGTAIGVAGLALFSAFALADLAPDNPPRLAAFTAGYWMFAFAGMCVFGRDSWLSRGECFTMLFRLFGKISPVLLKDGRGHIGLPGWQLAGAPRQALAVFALTALAAGSFDGLNETFWWLGLIGVNPLEFPGRSAVTAETIGGMLGAILLLHAVFAFCVWAGHVLARRPGEFQQNPRFGGAFSRLALSVLPIALGYHFAHFLPAFLVNSQYLAAAANDPLTTGADLLGLGVFYVTTGFFNTQDTVRVILLTQCAAIVAGHVIAVLVAHSIALDLYRSTRRAAYSQIPMGVFMVLYTLLSLWLLASPRGA